MILPEANWSVINTALILGAIGYLYRQARMVDQVRQSLLGIEGQGGIIGEIKLLRERSHDLANEMASLSGTVQELTRTMEERKQRR